jgi:hypothetical protein
MDTKKVYIEILEISWSRNRSRMCQWMFNRIGKKASDSKSIIEIVHYPTDTNMVDGPASYPVYLCIPHYKHHHGRLTDTDGTGMEDIVPPDNMMDGLVG